MAIRKSYVSGHVKFPLLQQQNYSAIFQGSFTKKERFVSMVGGNTKFRIESTKERKEEDKKAALKELFEEYLNVPLIGENMEEIMKKTKEIIGKEDFTIKKVRTLARELGFDVKDGKITKKQIKQFKLDESEYQKRYYMITL